MQKLLQAELIGSLPLQSPGATVRNFETKTRCGTDRCKKLRYATGLAKDGETYKHFSTNLRLFYGKILKLRFPDAVTTTRQCGKLAWVAGVQKGGRWESENSCVILPIVLRALLTLHARIFTFPLPFCTPDTQASQKK